MNTLFIEADTITSTLIRVKNVVKVNFTLSVRERLRCRGCPITLYTLTNLINFLLRILLLFEIAFLVKLVIPK